MNDPILRLACDMREAVERYIASGVPSCEAGCRCPLTRTLEAAVHFVDCVERFERGEILPPDDGLPL